MTGDARKPGQEAQDDDRAFALAECQALHELVMKHFDAVVATERYALAGAAALAAFSATVLTGELERMRILISATPFLILSLAALRCLTIYWAMKSALSYVRRVEERFLTDPMLGYQRTLSPDAQLRIRRGIEGVSALFWSLAVAASLVFWLLINDIF